MAVCQTQFREKTSSWENSRLKTTNMTKTQLKEEKHIRPPEQDVSKQIIWSKNGNKAGFRMACFPTTEATRTEIKCKRQLKQK